jgi:hypothetical protein
MWGYKQDLVYDKANLAETIRYCKAHNVLLRDLTVEDVETAFWEQIAKKTGGFGSASLILLQGQMEPVFNAWFYIDRLLGSHPINSDAVPGTHVVNFFVRMGRKPAMGIVE